jgi:hypothetical protein
MAKKIIVRDIEVRFQRIDNNDYISLTDLAKYKTLNPDLVIGHWMRTRNTIDYLTAWETLYNPKFNPTEIGGFRSDSSLNTFTLSPTRWIEATNAVGIVSKPGRYGGTYAHKDIAFKFASYLSVEFELYVIKEFQRLKESEQVSLEWTAKRELAKINYRIHTDAIKENLLVPDLTDRQIGYVYANEADLLNVALFGKTAGQWRAENPDIKGNIRDYAGVEQLLVLANLESYNAVLIEEKRSQEERIVLLNKTASKQFDALIKSVTVKSEKLLGLLSSENS